MDKRKVMKFLIWVLNILIIFLLVWSIINYKFLNKEVTALIATGGIVMMILSIIFLEGAPVFVGPSVAVAAILSMNTFNPWFILLTFLLSAIVGNIIYFYLGYFSGEKIFKYFEKKDVTKYKKVFKKYGRFTMLVMALSPIPYLPTLAGVFRIKSKYLIFETLAARLLRHTIVFFFWLFVLDLI
jgi:membrane protein YqaA with SNARE-associated domain